MEPRKSAASSSLLASGLNVCILLLAAVSSSDAAAEALLPGGITLPLRIQQGEGLGTDGGPNDHPGGAGPFYGPDVGGNDGENTNAGSADKTISILRLSLPSVGEAWSIFSSSRQEDLASEIRRQQSEVIARIQSLDCGGGEVEIIGATQKVLNAIIVRTENPDLLQKVVKDDDVLSATVNSVTRDGTYQMALAETVDYIWDGGEEESSYPASFRSSLTGHEGLPLDGTGVTVAVLDSGVDYTHSALGGPGTVEAYQEAHSDPKVAEYGTFPTAKVIGGKDFDGREEGSSLTGVDDDPIDNNGHGTSVADIIGGELGVAPGASILAVKVCGPGGDHGCPGHALLLGLEWALNNGADIINLSLGGSYGQPFDDDLSAALHSASLLGVLSVAAGGNCGNSPYCTASPGSSATVLSVAQTQVPRGSGPTMRLKLSESDGGDAFQAVGFEFSELPDLEQVVDVDDPLLSGELVYLPFKTDGCQPFLADLTGMVVMIDRGTCFFSTKIKNVQNAGGSAAIVANNVPGRPFSGGNGDGYDDFTIPGYMISLDDANIIKEKGLPLNDDVAILPPESGSAGAGWTVSSSARGPDMSYGRIKPEIGAPGSSIAADVGTGDGTSAFGGTSGASPVVAGAAALIKQMCPSCGPLDVKALLMNNAYRGIKSDEDGGPAAVSRIGAGEVRIGDTLTATFFAYEVQDGQPSLGLGAVDVDADVVIRKTVRVVNLSKEDTLALSLTSYFRLEEHENTGAVTIATGLSGMPGAFVSGIVVDPCSDVEVDVLFTITASKVPVNGHNSGELADDPAALGGNEFDGYFVLKSDGPGGDGREIALPWHVLARRASDAVPRSTHLSPVASKTFLLSNSGAGTAQVDAYDLIAISDEKLRGGRGKQTPTPDLRAAGYKTERVPSSVCTSEVAVEFALTLWDRVALGAAVTFYVRLDTDGDGEEDYVLFNKGVKAVINVFDKAEDTVEETDFALVHGTHSKTAALRACGERVGIDGADEASSAWASNMTASFSADDAIFAGPGDEVTSPFAIRPFGEVYRLGETPADRTQRADLGDAYDVPPNEVVSLPVYNYGTEVGTNSDSLGLMLITDDARPDSSHYGASTESSEVHLLLAPGVAGPVPLDAASRIEVVPTKPAPSTLTCASLPTPSPTSSPTSTMAPTTSPAPSWSPTTSTAPTYAPTEMPVPSTTAAAPGSSGAGSGPCIDDTTIIYEAEMALSSTPSPDYSVKRTYVLCPDTVYPVGIWDADIEVYLEGQAALEIFQPNVEILCGDDGRSENNCILEGGEFHAYIFDSGAAGDLHDVLISGVTFKGAADLNVYSAASTSGDGVVFRDCVFKDNVNAAPVYASASSSASLLTLDSCLFESNSFPSSGSATGNEVALIYNVGQRMKVVSTEFVDNDAPAVPRGDGSGMEARTAILGNFYGGSMELTSSCFERNGSTFAAALSVGGGSSTEGVEGESNYVRESRIRGSGGNLPFCEGLGKVDEGGCVMFSATTCGATERRQRRRRRRTALRGTAES